ncbi:MAG: electron transfer flavoprotein-ubiquinone oxidoreductase [Pseudomonadota bacterium]
MNTAISAPNPARDHIDFDVVIVGGGPAGLSCAIRLKQLKPDMSVCILEKGGEVGAHLLSGAVIETRALDELLPDWRNLGAPIHDAVTKDQFIYLTRDHAMPMPTPPQMANHGNYIISLSAFGRWLSDQATALGVEIFPGFAVAEALVNDQNQIIGVATRDMGIGRDGQPTAHFQPGVEIWAKHVILAEGAHGSISKAVIAHYNLREGASPQTYGLGIKEVWEVAPDKHRPGLVQHTAGWPLDNATYGGSWIYHYGQNLVSIGLVVGLDYQNPHLFPFGEMQRFKTHPAIRDTFAGGRRIAYGARVLVEGGLQSLPRLVFPGGMLIGDSAGFLNVPKIKGNHAAMKSGMLAAEAIAADAPATYPDLFRASWLWQELHKVRNIRPGFRWGFWGGFFHAAFQTLGGWLLPYTLKNHADHTQLKRADDCQKITYPKPDGTLTFDRLTSVALTGTNHEEDQPVHLRLADPAIPIAVNLPLYDEPAQRYCPAAVYEVLTQADGTRTFQINAQNCIHCKACDIKDPSQNINWVVPQGGEGPNYSLT